MQLAGLLLGVIGSRADVTAWSLAYVAFFVVGAVGFSVLAISFTRRHPPSRWVVVLGVVGAPVMLGLLLVVLPMVLAALGLFPR